MKNVSAFIMMSMIRRRTVNKRITVVAALLLASLALFCVPGKSKIGEETSEPTVTAAPEPTAEATVAPTAEPLKKLYGSKPAATKVDITGRTKEELKTMFYIKKIDDDTWKSMQGKSYHKGCPVKRSGLRRVRILYYGYDKKTRVGELICNKKIATDLRDIFKKLYFKKYQIKRVVPIDAYDGDDRKSMTKDNTSCFNYRTVEGTNTISKHGYGVAIDINPVENPYVVGSYVSPKNGKPYANRSKKFAHKIDKKDLCYKLFHKAGFFWGGDWKYTKDYQHFQKTIDS